jgi:hypothetical protein
MKNPTFHPTDQSGVTGQVFFKIRMSPNPPDQSDRMHPSFNPKIPGSRPGGPPADLRTFIISHESFPLTSHSPSLRCDDHHDQDNVRLKSERLNELSAFRAVQRAPSIGSDLVARIPGKSRLRRLFLERKLNCCILNCNATCSPVAALDSA